MDTEDMVELLEKIEVENNIDLHCIKVSLLQYQNLRDCFNKVITEVLGKDYYNFGMDIYSCDRITCEDIIAKK